MWSHPSASDESNEEVLRRRGSYEAAGKVFDHLSRRMRLVFLQRLLSCGECNTENILEILANTAMQRCSSQTTQTVLESATAMRLGRSRHMTAQELERAAVQLAVNRDRIMAMDIPLSPDDEYKWQEKAWDDARLQIEEASHNIDAAERELGHTHNQLQRARDIMSDRMLSDSTLSVQRLAKHAAKAQGLLSELLDEFEKPKPDAVKVAERSIRGIVMLCCRAQAGIKDPNDFWARAAQAYDVPQITNKVKAQLMLSYSKHEDNKQCGFPSNNAYANDQKGPRPSKNKESNDTHLAISSQEPGDTSTRCATATTFLNYTVASVADTADSAYTVAVSTSVEKTINQDQQQDKDDFQNEFGEAMHINQEASCQTNDEWKTVPNYATPGHSHLDDQTSDIHGSCTDPTQLQQLAEFHLQAQHWHMEQSTWYANEYQKQTEELLTFWVVESKRMNDIPSCYANSSVRL